MSGINDLIRGYVLPTALLVGTAGLASNVAANAVYSEAVSISKDKQEYIDRHPEKKFLLLRDWPPCVNYWPNTEELRGMDDQTLEKKLDHFKDYMMKGRYLPSTDALNRFTQGVVSYDLDVTNGQNKWTLMYRNGSSQTPLKEGLTLVVPESNEEAKGLVFPLKPGFMNYFRLDSSGSIEDVIILREGGCDVLNSLDIHLVNDWVKGDFGNPNLFIMQKKIARKIDEIYSHMEKAKLSPGNKQVDSGKTTQPVLISLSY